MPRPQPRTTVFPYTTLFRSRGLAYRTDASNADTVRGLIRGEILPLLERLHPAARANILRALDRRRDRKSTRLNSSHMSISYAVFCLKKKKIFLRFRPAVFIV